MLSIIPGESTFKETCSTNFRKVHTILTDTLGVANATANTSLECFFKPEDIGKSNAYFIALAVHFDLNMNRYTSGTSEEKHLWDTMKIPTKMSIMKYVESNRETISKMLKLTKGRTISTEMQSQALFRMWRFLMKSRAVYRTLMEEEDASLEDAQQWNSEEKNLWDMVAGTQPSSEGGAEVRFQFSEDEDEGEDMVDIVQQKKHFPPSQGQNKSALDYLNQDLVYSQDVMQYEGDEEELSEYSLSAELNQLDII